MNNREAFEAWAVSHGGLDLTMHEAMDNEKLPFMCTYYNYTTEIAWRAFANKKVPVQAALASQVQQPDAFTSGVAYACARLVEIFDQTTMAAEIMRESGAGFSNIDEADSKFLKGIL